jgi:hypothetical protein
MPDHSKTFSEALRDAGRIAADFSKGFGRAMRQAKLRANGLGPPEEDPHPKTVEWCRSARPCLSDCSSVNRLVRDVADKRNASKKTAEKWLCHRMPDSLYEPGSYDSVDERYKYLRRAILQVDAFTESP